VDESATPHKLAGHGWHLLEGEIFMPKQAASLEKIYLFGYLINVINGIARSYFCRLVRGAAGNISRRFRCGLIWSISVCQVW
jgi:hypothetical protein